MPASTLPTSPPRRSRWRIFRRVTASVFLLALLSAFLARNAIIQWTVPPAIEKATGGICTMSGARWTGLAEVSVEDISLRVKGWDGPSGEVLQLSGCTAYLRFSQLLLGRVQIERMSIETATLRIAERHNAPLHANIGALQPPSDGARIDESIQFGDIDIASLLIDVGIEEHGTFESVSKEQFTLNVAPIGADSLHAFRLRKLDETENVASEFKGWWNPTSQTFSVEVDDLDLGSGSSLTVLASVRETCERMNLTGRLKQASLDWKVGGALLANLAVESIGLTLPEELGLEDEWSRVRNGRLEEESPPPPRMELLGGRIEFDGEHIVMRNFRGQLLPSDGNPLVAPIKIRFDADVTLPREEAWSEQLFRTAPFDLNLTVSEFTHASRRNDGDSIADLPRPIAVVLAALQARKWDLGATVNATRNSTEATVFLAGGQGAYIGFDYPLENVTGEIHATRDSIRIDSLRGLTPHGLELQIQGEFNGVGRDAAVDMHISGEAIPIDQNMLDALPASTRRAVGQLFDHLATERLSEAGLLPTTATIEAARERAQNLRTESNEAELTGNLHTIERFADERRRMEALVAAGAFKLGGQANIDFSVHRDHGPDAPVTVEGTLDLDRVGVVFESFPYPFIATSGQLRVGPDAIAVTEPGILITTPAGGTGRITGHVDLIDNNAGGRDAHPRVDIVLANDFLNPSLLAAVPPESETTPTAASVEGWPGVRFADAVKPIQEIGIGGSIDCHATIQTRHDGQIEVRAALDLKNGHLIPPEGRQRFTEAGKAWPRGLSLHTCEATIVIEPEEIALRSFKGYRGDGEVRAEGTFNRTNDDALGHVVFENFAIEPYVLELLPDEVRQQANDLHARWRPKGTFDGVLDWQHQDAKDTALFTIKPNTLTITSDDQSQTLLRSDGEVRIAERSITIADVALVDETQSSRFEIDGHYSWYAPETSHSFTASVHNGSIDSPFIAESLRLAAGEEFGKFWHGRAPQGTVAATMAFQQTATTHLAHVDVQLDSLTLLATPYEKESRGGGTMDPTGHIVYDNGDLIIEPLFIRCDGDTVLEVNGRALNLDNSGVPRVDVTYSLAGSSSNIPEVGFLPPPYNKIVNPDALTTGVFNAQGDAHIEFAQNTNEIAALESLFHLAFVDGAFDLGSVHLHDIAGTTEHTLLVEDGVVSEISGMSTFPEVRVEDRRLHDLRFSSTLVPSSSTTSTIDFHLTEGTLYGGPVRGHLLFAPKDDWFRAEFQGVDVAADGLLNPTKPATPPTPGRVLARIAAEGTFSDPESWVGRGELVLLDTVIAGNSNALALLRAGQLMPPTVGGLDQATVSFLLDGNEAILSRILLDSPTLQLLGSGRLRLSDLSIAARLLPKGQLGALSDLVSAVTGTVYALDIEGPLWAPSTRLTALPMMVAPPDIDPQPPAPETPTE